MNRIGINALCYSPQRAGISNYIYNLIQQYDNLKFDTEFIVFLPSSAKNQITKSDNIIPIFLSVPHLFIRILMEQFLLPLLFFTYRLEVLHSTGNVASLLLGKKNIVTIHDIYFLHDLKRFGFIKHNYLKVFVRLSAVLSKRIICVSNSTANDIKQYYSINKDKIKVIYSGIQNYTISNHNVNKVKEKFNINNQYFLFVGTIEPGKNLKGLINGFAEFDNKDEYSIVVVGKSGWGNKELRSIIEVNKLEKKIIFTDYVTDDELGLLYKNAAALILPSFHEGFGLPIIEAMFMECPVCCSNTSCLPEIAGEAALFFDPYDFRSIADALNTVIKWDVKKKLIQKGLENIKRFSWEECARSTFFELHIKD